MQSDADSRTGLDVSSELDASAEMSRALRVEAQRERKFWVAMGMYGLLAVLVWFTLGEGTTSVLGRRIEIRWIPLFVLGTFVFRTWMAREADKVRRRSQLS
jgi:hypothetical protein